MFIKNCFAISQIFLRKATNSIMPKSTKEIVQTVSFRLPVRLIVALDKIVKKRSPAIKDRTQLVEVELTNVVKSEDKSYE